MIDCIPELFCTCISQVIDMQTSGKLQNSWQWPVSLKQPHRVPSTSVCLILVFFFFLFAPLSSSLCFLLPPAPESSLSPPSSYSSPSPSSSVTLELIWDPLVDPVPKKSIDRGSADASAPWDLTTCKIKQDYSYYWSIIYLCDIFISWDASQWQKQSKKPTQQHTSR